MRARNGRARHAVAVAKTRREYIYPGDALRLIDSSYFDELSRDGSAIAAESELRHSE